MLIMCIREQDTQHAFLSSSVGLEILLLQLGKVNFNTSINLVYLFLNDGIIYLISARKYWHRDEMAECKRWGEDFSILCNSRSKTKGIIRCGLVASGERT